MPDTIEERLHDGSLSSGDVEAGRPVVFRGLARDWPAVAAARRRSGDIGAYLTRLDKGVEAELFVAPPEVGGRFVYADGLKGMNFTKQRATVAGLLQDLHRAALLPQPLAVEPQQVVLGESESADGCL